MGEKFAGRNMKDNKKPAGKKSRVLKVDGKSVSPQKELAQLLKAQFPQIFAEQCFLLATESTENTEFFSTRINTPLCYASPGQAVFARPGVFDEPCFLSELSRRIRLHPPCGQKKVPTFSSQAKDTDLIDDQLKNKYRPANGSGEDRV